MHHGVLGGSLVERWLVRPDLEAEFGYQQGRLAEMLAEGSKQPGIGGSRGWKPFTSSHFWSTVVIP